MRTWSVVALVATAACSEPVSSGRCATVVAEEVCYPPSNLRGAEPVQETWTTEPAPELSGQPLADGRYVLTARTSYCPGRRNLPDFEKLLQKVVEVSGCVLKMTTVMPPDEEQYIGVTTFNYAADGSLEETTECDGDVRLTSSRHFSFDGTTLTLVDASEADGPPDNCTSIDTLELR